jgi:fatty-acyl-CoA synthase
VRDLSKASAWELLGLLRRIPFRRSDRHLVAAPLYHATASGFAGIHLALGSTLHVMEKFDPVEFLATVDREKITTSALVPTMLRAILEIPAEQRAKFDARSLRIIVSTGSALPEGLERAAGETFGDVLYDLYGSTEMGYVTVATPQDKRACPGTIGLPIPGVEVALLDDRRQPVPDGEVGELFAKSRLTVEGYHANEAATKESRFGDYFSVGDLAIRDPRGYLKLVGRKTDMVISGGMNIYPAEIEAVLAAHPAIREAAVIGVPDEKWGETLVAFVVPKDRAEIPADGELIDFCKKSLAGYKVPRRFERAAGLPRNPTGKVLKQDLRAQVVGSAGATPV